MNKFITVVLTSACLSTLAMTSAIAEPIVLKSHDQILAALKSGHAVRAVFNFDDCKLLSKSGTGNADDDFNGDFIGMDFATFSNTHWTADGKAKKGIVSTQTAVAKFENYNFRTFAAKVFEDNTTEFMLTIADSNTHQLIKSYTWNCKVGGLEDHSGSVFTAR